MMVVGNEGAYTARQAHHRECGQGLCACTERLACRRDGLGA